METLEVIVTNVQEKKRTLQGSETRLFVTTVKTYDPAYAKGDFPVILLEPVALAEEYLMQDGKFFIDTMEQLQIGRKVKIRLVLV
jgi:hypothetical protein